MTKTLTFNRLKRLWIIYLMSLMPFTVEGQDVFSVYFDPDTIVQYGYKIDLDSSNSIWQIGQPLKTIFDSASSFPNALITDTLNYYPPNDTSKVEITFYQGTFWTLVMAIQWKQKLDYEAGKDGGVVEYKTSRDSIWRSVFDNQQVFKFYGFDSSNLALLQSGDSAFTGTDSSWKDIWLCFDYRLGTFLDSISIRFTSLSDSSIDQKEGWMIDNLSLHSTFIHTVKENDNESLLKVFPNPTNGILNLHKQETDFGGLTRLELLTSNGSTIEVYEGESIPRSLDLGALPSGLYYLRVFSSESAELHKIVLDSRQE